MNNTNLGQSNKNIVQGVVPPTSTTTPTTPIASSNPTLAEPSAKEGLNLIPAMSKEEKVKIQTKNTLNIGSILSIIALASIALGIVSFNIVSKAQLNSRKSSLARIENTTKSKIDKIMANNAIVDRAVLYSKVKKDSFSHKKIIEFFEQVASQLSNIYFRSIDITEGLNFEISGTAPNLEILSKLWYLFGVNENIKVISLDSVSKNEDEVSFSFEGDLDITNFRNE